MSILSSVKKIVGIPEGYDHFDIDLIIHINAVLAELTQIGVGPSDGFAITGNDEDWYEFVPSVNARSMVQSYVGLKVKSMFDPSANSAVTSSTDRILEELLWRLNLDHESNG